MPAQRGQMTGGPGTRSIRNLKPGIGVISDRSRACDAHAPEQPGNSDRAGRQIVARHGCPSPRPANARSRKVVISSPFYKADDGSRTRDLRLGKPTLYQLSYVRKWREMLATRGVTIRGRFSRRRGIRQRAGASLQGSSTPIGTNGQQTDDLHQPAGVRRQVGAQPELAAVGLGRSARGRSSPSARPSR